MNARGLLIRTHDGCAYRDWPPPFQYAHPDHNRMVRAMEPFIVGLYSDAEAFDAIGGDESRLAVFKAVYGNRKGPKRRHKSPTLVEVA